MHRLVKKSHAVKFGRMLQTYLPIFTMCLLLCGCPAKQIVPERETAPTAQQPVKKTPSDMFNSGCVVLALPLSGPYAPYGRKIEAGAQAAKTNLAQAGHTMTIHTINTDASDWIDQMQALPAECIVTGGPMQTSAYKKAKERKISSAKVFFTFFPNLEGNDEGTKAWRFFPGSKDQIDAVLRFSENLGIKKYGIVLPAKDDYGERISQIFSSTAQAHGDSVSAHAYDAEESPQNFMHSLVQSADFQAIFWPDTWQNVEKMLPWLFNEGDERFVLMGTALWEQGLARKTQPNMEHLDLVIFPGAWDIHRSTKAASALVQSLSPNQPDLWNAIGFDFVRFASALNLNTQGWDANTVNQRINQAQKMEWSMAPIDWTQGHAAQQLFLFQPAATGFARINEQNFRNRLEEIKAIHAKRRTND